MSYKRANGTGSVYKIKTGRRRKPWVACVTVGWELVDGKAKQKVHIIGTYRTQNEATIALSEYNKLPYQAENANMTFLEVYEYWKKRWQGAKASAIAYQTAFNNLRSLWDRPYRQIIPAHVEDAMSSLSPSSQYQAQALIKNLDDTAVKLDIPIKHIHRGISIAPKEKPKERKIFTEDEIDLLWQNTDDYYCRVVLIYLYTGWRGRELLNMKKNDVDFNNWTMKGGSKTAAGKERIVPIHPRIRPFVKELCEEDHVGLLRVNSYSPVQKYIGQLFHRLGFNHIIHETRHTFRTRLYNAQVDPVVIDKLCGHIPSGSVGNSVYTHISLEQLRDAVERLR